MTLVPREAWHQQVQAARDGGARFFDLLTAVDLDEDGFELVLHLWDPAARTGVLLRTRCPRDDARFPTVVTLFGGAAWHERAAAEMFGLAFDGHPTDPLLLPETFAGHPLRKDFVLASRMVKAWPGAKDPGESDADLASREGARPARRRPQPLGRPSGWADAPAARRQPPETPA